MDNPDQTSMDGASNTDTATSKKPQQKGNTPSMNSAKQEVKNIPRDTERDVPGRAGAAMAKAAAGEDTEAPYEKVRELPTGSAEPHSCCLSTPMYTGGFSGTSCHSSTAGKAQHSWKHSWGADGFHWEMLRAEK